MLKEDTAQVVLTDMYTFCLFCSIFSSLVFPPAVVYSSFRVRRQMCFISPSSWISVVSGLVDISDVSLSLLDMAALGG